MPDAHLAVAVQAVGAILKYLEAASTEVDPVERRREQVRIARQLRAVADALDDMGRLTE